MAPALNNITHSKGEASERFATEMVQQCPKEEDLDEESEDWIMDMDNSGYEYTYDIHALDSKTENRCFVSPSYMAQQPDINKKMRAILIDWLVQVEHGCEGIVSRLFPPHCFRMPVQERNSLVQDQLRPVSSASHQMYLATFLNSAVASSRNAILSSTFLSYLDKDPMPSSLSQVWSENSRYTMSESALQPKANSEEIESDRGCELELLPRAESSLKIGKEEANGSIMPGAGLDHEQLPLRDPFQLNNGCSGCSIADWGVTGSDILKEHVEAAKSDLDIGEADGYERWDGRSLVKLLSTQGKKIRNKGGGFVYVYSGFKLEHSNGLVASLEFSVLSLVCSSFRKLYC